MVQQRNNVKSAGHYSRINPNMVIMPPVGQVMSYYDADYPRNRLMEVTYLFQLMLFFLCKDNRQQTDKIDMVMRILVAWDIIHLASHKCVLILYILIIGPKNTWS